MQDLITTLSQLETGLRLNWTQGHCHNNIQLKSLCTTQTFVFSLYCLLKLACCLLIWVCLPLETCVLSLCFVPLLSDTWKTLEKQATPRLCLTSKTQNTPHIHHCLISMSWKGKRQKRKYNCSGSFPSLDFKVFVKSAVAGWSINYWWGWSIIGADTFHICVHLIYSICRWYLWPHPLRAVDDILSQFHRC